MRHAFLEQAKLSTSERRAALRWGIASGVLWAMGNGLTTGALVYYLALELGASGKQLALILAAQSMIGILRFGVPSIIRRLGGVKPAAITMFLAAYLVLTLLPLVSLGAFPDAYRLMFFIGLLAVHQLLESLASVALWAWLGELVPSRLRGRYFATRQRWQLIALVPTLAAAGWFADWWHAEARDASSLEAILLGYTLPIGLGAGLLLASVVPLWRMPAVTVTLAPRGSWRGGGNLAPLADGRFRRVLLLGCWLSFFNGIPQSALNIYPKRELGFGLWPMMLLTGGMRIGQIVLTPWVGRFSDRYGNRPVLFASQLVVAFGPLFFLLATPKEPWWLAGAFLAYSAYAGLNVCLPNLTLKLSRGGNYAAYSAAYFALSGLAYGIATCAGGWLFDLFRFDHFYVSHFRLDHYGYLFYVGWLTRLLALVLILGIDEPGAWSWRRFIFGRGATKAVSAEVD